MLLMAAAVPSAIASTPIGHVTDITVTKNGIGPAHEKCAAFALTPAQVRSFLERAVLLSGRQQHDWFLHGPCSATGTLVTRYDTWRWEIRNLGTATLTATNGDVFVLGDPEQESSLAKETP